jgi:hypothetical protein
MNGDFITHNARNKKLTNNDALELMAKEEEDYWKKESL